MRAVVQRVRHASVTIAGDVVGKIDVGLLALIGAGHDDTREDAKYLVDKLVGLQPKAKFVNAINSHVGAAT